MGVRLAAGVLDRDIGWPPKVVPPGIRGTSEIRWLQFQTGGNGEAR